MRYSQCIVSRTIVTPHLLAALVIRNSHYELFWHEHFAQCQRAEQQPNLDCAVSLSAPSIVDRLRDTAVARIVFDAVSFLDTLGLAVNCSRVNTVVTDVLDSKAPVPNHPVSKHLLSLFVITHDEPQQTEQSSFLLCTNSPRYP